MDDSDSRRDADSFEAKEEEELMAQEEELEIPRRTSAYSADGVMSQFFCWLSPEMQRERSEVLENVTRRPFQK